MRDLVPEVEVDSCHHCPMRGPTTYGVRMDGKNRRCQLAGVAVSYGRVPQGCPLRGGPVQITLSRRARESL